MPYPQTSNGFIDEAECFKTVVGVLGMPVEYMDTLSPIELSWLVEAKSDTDKTHYEYIARAYQVGFLRAHGKKVEMFKNTGQGAVGTITQEAKQSELEYLNTLNRKTPRG